MRIGIFGGSFNPPHKMHVKIADYILKNGYLDKIIFVPTGIHYEYKKDLANDEARFEMLLMALEGKSKVEVSDFEQNGKLVYTVETLEHFKELYQADEIYFVCGADNLSYIDKWKNGLSILENYKILVVGRQTENLYTILEKFHKFRDNIIVVDMPLNGLSSTMIRDRIRSGKDVSEYINPKVLKYIKKNNLYNG